MEQNDNQLPQSLEDKNLGQSVCFHYVFEDPEQHHIDARTLVRCEMEYLVLSEEIAKILGVEMEIYTKPKTEGSLWDVFFSILPDWNEIASSVITKIIAQVVVQILKDGYDKFLECLKRFLNKEKHDTPFIYEVIESYNIVLLEEEKNGIEIYLESLIRKSSLYRISGKDSSGREKFILRNSERMSNIHKRFNNSIKREKTLKQVETFISECKQIIHID